MVGSVRVFASGRMGGVLRFDIPAVGVAGVGASEPVNDAIFPARRMAGGINTGAAIRNLSSEPMIGDLSPDAGRRSDGYEDGRAWPETAIVPSSSTRCSRVRIRPTSWDRCAAPARRRRDVRRCCTGMDAAERDLHHPPGGAAERCGPAPIAVNVDAELCTLRQRRLRRNGNQFRLGLRERGQLGGGPRPSTSTTRWQHDRQPIW